MYNPLTAELLALPLSGALKVLASFNTLEHLPASIFEPVQDLADAALACFPEAEAAFWQLMDAQGLNTGPDTFDYIADACRLLAPAVESAVYPITAKNGAVDVVINIDTPLLVMLPRTQTLELVAAA
ncbi:hypothetical protein [Arthrobacter sp. 162MFSha1.1]|uniref:hypothetical protein n=1 Tax=Arthrobacter sp. 162MFSha1.1 TaxID=1151119 RepID=UPI0003815064|nr:hypothetical protein [Arthrobacter sp. 162MFSha1.1]